MPRHHSSRSSKRLKKSCADKCSTMYCPHFARPGGKHCSKCPHGSVDPLEHLAKCKRYQQRVMNHCRRVAVSDNLFQEFIEGTGGEIIPFMRNVSRYEKNLPELGLAKVMFTARQVMPLMQGYQSNSVYNLVNQKQSTILPPDQVLGRVIDHWNLGHEGFPSTIRCYWGSFGDYLAPIKFFKGRGEIDQGIMKALLYCARSGDTTSIFRQLTAGKIIREFNITTA